MIIKTLWWQAAQPPYSLVPIDEKPFRIIFGTVPHHINLVHFVQV
jgi:hypothetical protein